VLAIRIYRISGITVCSEISDYMQKNKEADIVDIIQGSVLIKEKDRACEFNISTKKVKRLKQLDINYWYVFGGHS